MLKQLWGALPILTCVALVSACGNKKGPKSAEQADGEESGSPKVDASLCDTKGKKISTFDLNKDNRPDVWKLYRYEDLDGARVQILTCKQIDLNHDGKKDMVTAYRERGGKEFEKLDFDWDGKFDAYMIYDSKGKLIEAHRDSDYDGRYDLKEIYDSNQRIKSIRRDRNGDSEPDVWEQFENGALVAILYDEDFDGKVDRREEAGDSKKDKKDESTDKPADGADTPADGTDAPAAEDGGEDGEAADPAVSDATED